MEEKGKSKNGKIKALKFPSKVLLAGGYGVLQEGNEGFVLALQNYFYAT
jgi:phosphomevalonate kinase